MPGLLFIARRPGWLRRLKGARKPRRHRAFRKRMKELDATYASRCAAAGDRPEAGLLCDCAVERRISLLAVPAKARFVESGLSLRPKHKRCGAFKIAVGIVARY
jgi:hypothetical protein